MIHWSSKSPANHDATGIIVCKSDIWSVISQITEKEIEHHSLVSLVI